MTTKEMTPVHSVIIAGGPDAGKTNYIGRLWLAIAGSHSMLKSIKNPTDLEHLEAVSQSLVSGQFAPHTSLNAEQVCEIPVTCLLDPTFRGQLVIPDRSGESWLQTIESRSWPAGWDPLVNTANGILLFMRVDSEENVGHLSWMDCHAKLGSTEKPGAADSGANEPEVPTQVVMVEWVQFFLRLWASRAASAPKPRVAVVVTAWDLRPLENQDSDPAEYVREEFPLLAQFMESNAERFESRVFGVSVAGGDLKTDSAFRQAYLDGTPENAGYVLHRVGPTLVRKDIDLSIPVVWALGISGSGGSAGE